MNSSNSIFISGVTHGIGKATAELFCKQGWIVYGCAKNEEDSRGKEMEETLPNFYFFKADVTKEDEVKEMFQKIPELTVAFNNAGIGCVPHSIGQMNYQEAFNILNVNVLGVGLCMKYEVEKKPRLIINNASVSAFKSKTGCDAFYAASKAAVITLTREISCMSEYQGKIDFCSISPAFIKTRMTADDQQKDSSNHWKSPNFVAQNVFNLATQKHPHQSGENFNINHVGE